MSPKNANTPKSLIAGKLEFGERRFARVEISNQEDMSKQSLNNPVSPSTIKAGREEFAGNVKDKTSLIERITNAAKVTKERLKAAVEITSKESLSVREIEAEATI